MASTTRPAGPTAVPRSSSVGGDGHDRATAELVKDVVGGTQNLVRKELELARLELMEGVSAKAQAAGLGGAAAVLGLYVVGFLGLAAGAALGQVMAQWAAWLIVAGAFLLVLLVLGLVARSRARSTPLVPEKTKATLQKDVAWAKRLMRR